MSHAPWCLKFCKMLINLLIHFDGLFIYCVTVDCFHDTVCGPSAALHDVLIWNTDSMHDAGGIMPLRYNNDKQKKPLFSRGLSVCRLLFNSFSKLKIDENYKEKRRLFY